MKKVMMLTTTAYMSERFNRENILILQEMGYQVDVVANFDRGNPISDEKLDEFKKWIAENGATWHSIALTKSPKDVGNFRKARKQTLELIAQNDYAFIHCHTPMGGALGRVIARESGTKVIYTAHGFHFYKGAPLSYWCVFYPVEKFFSRWTDLLITINREDYDRASRKLKAKRTEYIPGIGINPDQYHTIGDRAKARRKLTEELGIPEDSKLVLSVGELNANKNHETVMRAILSLQDPDIHYLVCGQGGLREYLEQFIAEQDAHRQIHLLGYRNDVPDLVQCVDVFAFPSKREGLSVALMEAVSAGTPIMASAARGNGELVRDGVNGYLCRENTPEEYAEALPKLLTMDRTGVGRADAEIIRSFTEDIVSEKMKKLYAEMGG